MRRCIYFKKKWDKSRRVSTRISYRFL